MKLREYIESDKEQINNWFYLRKLNNLPLINLPQIGYIVPDVAAGFLIKTDFNFCILEPFFSNPEAPKEVRDEALDQIIIKLTEYAKNNKFSALYGFSTSVPMIKRGLKHGFTICELQSTTIFKEIT